MPDDEFELYICIPCGYVYDPSIGDLTQAVEPGVRFADLADDWWCPGCGVDKTQFALL